MCVGIYTFILLILLRFSDFIIIISLVKLKEKFPTDLIKDLFDGYIDRIKLSLHKSLILKYIVIGSYSRTLNYYVIYCLLVAI